MNFCDRIYPVFIWRAPHARAVSSIRESFSVLPPSLLRLCVNGRWSGARVGGPSGLPNVEPFMLLSEPRPVTHRAGCSLGSDERIQRYPVDVAYGTAIPHWAFYDVTVRRAFTHRSNLAASQFNPDFIDPPEPDLQRHCSRGCRS